MAHYIESKQPVIKKKSTGKRIREVLIVFGIFLIVGFFFFKGDSSGSSPLKGLKLNPKGKYVAEGTYTLSGEYKKFRLDPNYKFDYMTSDDLECTDADGKKFYLGPNAGIKTVASSGGYDLSEMYCRTINGANGSISFTNFRR